MALGERFRSGGAHGIARFLAEHQNCEAGFDVRRDEGLGSGRLRITCEGCGETVDYRAAEAGELAAGGLPVGAVPDNGEPAGRTPPPRKRPARRPAAPPPPPPPGVQRVGAPRRQPRSGLLPTWLSVGLISALIIGGLTMIAIGLATDDDEPATQAPTATEPEGAQSAPSGTEEDGASQPVVPGEAQPPESTGPAPESGAEVALERRTFANRFAIGVPPGWRKSVENGAITLTAPGATAEIAVFFEPGERPVQELARAARGFLADRHDGAQVAASKPFRLGPHRALRVEATYPRGEEVAVVLSVKGFSHLVLRRVDRGASPELEQQAEAALASYRPR